MKQIAYWNILYFINSMKGLLKIAIKYFKLHGCNHLKFIIKMLKYEIIIIKAYQTMCKYNIILILI